MQASEVDENVPVLGQERKFLIQILPVLYKEIRHFVRKVEHRLAEILWTK